MVYAMLWLIAFIFFAGFIGASIWLGCKALWHAPGAAVGTAKAVKRAGETLHNNTKNGRYKYDPMGRNSKDVHDVPKPVEKVMAWDTKWNRWDMCPKSECTYEYSDDFKSNVYVHR